MEREWGYGGAWGSQESESPQEFQFTPAFSDRGSRPRLRCEVWTKRIDEFGLPDGELLGSNSTAVSIIFAPQPLEVSTLTLRSQGL